MKLAKSANQKNHYPDNINTAQVEIQQIASKKNPARISDESADDTGTHTTSTPGKAKRGADFTPSPVKAKKVRMNTSEIRSPELSAEVSGLPDKSHYVIGGFRKLRSPYPMNPRVLKNRQGQPGMRYCSLYDQHLAKLDSYNYTDYNPEKSLYKRRVQELEATLRAKEIQIRRLNETMATAARDVHGLMRRRESQNDNLRQQLSDLNQQLCINDIENFRKNLYWIFC